MAESLLSSQPALAIPYIVLLSIVLTVALAGNTLIIGAFVVNRRVRIVGNEFALNLAISDLVISVFATPFFIVGVTNGRAYFDARPRFCAFTASVCLAACFCSFLTLTAVTIDRYVFFLHRQLHARYLSRRRVYVAICAGIWVAGFALEMPNFVGWGGHVFDDKHLACVWDRQAALSFTLFLACVLIGGPVLVMIFCYVRIFRHLRAYKRKIAAEQNGFEMTSLTPPKWLETLRSTRTFCLVLVGFIITWGPYALIVALDVHDTYPLAAHLYISGFAHLHTAMNCIIYGVTNAHFRAAFRRLLSLGACRGEEEASAAGGASDGGPQGGNKVADTGTSLAIIAAAGNGDQRASDDNGKRTSDDKDKTTNDKNDKISSDNNGKRTSEDKDKTTNG